MWLTHLKTLLTEAIKRTFDADYPEVDFRDLHASIEFPVEKQQYPGIWVDFEPTAALEIVGIDHHEWSDPSQAEQNRRRYRRWRFQGNATYTLVALTSLERDRLLDEVVRVVAFGTEQSSTAEFRSYVEDNEFIAINLDFDQIGLSGSAHTFGTPWETDDSVYEVTISIAAIGEFISDGLTQTLAPLSAIVVYPYAEGEADPLPGHDPDYPWM